MSKKLNTNVHVRDENGVAHAFGPGDDLPGWAEKAITNPSVFGDPEETSLVAPGPNQRTVFVGVEEAGEGPLEDRKVGQLRALAEANGVDSSGSKSELVARLQDAGLESPSGTNENTNVTA